MTEFLIVCPSKRRAGKLYDRIYDCLMERGIYNRSIKAYRSIIAENVVARFISESEYPEASKGFRGTVVSGYEVERALDEYIKTGGLTKCLPL